MTIDRVHYQVKQAGRRFVVDFDLLRGVASVQGAERDGLPRVIPMAYQSAAEAERLCKLYQEQEAEPAPVAAELPLDLLPGQLELRGFGGGG